MTDTLNRHERREQAALDRRAKIKPGHQSSKPIASSPTAELARLRAENAQLKAENAELRQALEDRHKVE
jgi:hypothetical protein